MTQRRMGKGTMTLRDPAKIAESRSRKVINKRLDIDVRVHVQPYVCESCHRLEAFADVFRGESFCRMRTRRSPDAGTAMSLPSTISLDVILRP